MNMRIAFSARSYASIFVATVAVSSMSSPAVAATGGNLQPGDVSCTDWLRTDGGGVYLRGYAGGSGVYTWTLRASSTPGGAETEILKITTREVMQQVTQPAGRLFYRSCLSVAGKPAIFYRLGVSPGVRAVNPVYAIGSHTATLAPGGFACGEFAMGPVFFRGSADRAFRWSVRGDDFDYAGIGEIFSVAGSSVDQLIDLPSWVFSVDACATNTSSANATVSFNFIEP
jgi:hypothetical protein